MRGTKRASQSSPKTCAVGTTTQIKGGILIKAQDNVTITKEKFEKDNSGRVKDTSDRALV